MAFIDLSDAVPSTPPSGFVDLSEEMKPPKPEGLLNTVGRGVKESFQQLPQLGYGVGAGVAAAGETAFGEGGIFTAAKQAAIKGYTDWGDKIAAHARENDSIDTAWGKAKEGDVGALVDWLAHGIGYTGGQAVQILATGGLGFAAGKATAEGAAKALASGMIKREATRIGASEAGKEIVTKVGATAAAEEIARLATANVAGKLGQTAALGVTALGMEAGEIFGDLTEKHRERSLTGEELGRAFGASVAAGGLEFLGDKLELSALTGKGVGSGILGRTGRAAAGAVAVAPAEGATEYGQTLLEEYGKGNEETINPFSVSDATQKQARESAALGALGGAVMGGVGGALSPKPKPAIVEAGDVESAVEAFRFSVANPDESRERFAAARLTYKDHTPDEIAANQETLARAVQTTPGFEIDDTGAPTLNGAPVKAVAAQELPAHGETDGLSRDAYEAIAALNAALGKKTVVFQDDERLPMDGFVNEAANPDTVFVSNRTKVDPAVVAAHETQHLLDGPQFAGFAAVVNEELTERAEAAARERHGADMPADKLAREIRADITGDAWADPTFHGRVLEKMRTQLGDKAAEKTATTFLDSVRELIDRVKAVLTGTTFVTADGKRLATEYVKNLERVHDALAAAVADHFVREGYRPPGGDTNTGKILVARALEQQRRKEEAAATPAHLQTPEQKIWANAKPVRVPETASAELKSAILAAQKPMLQRTPEEVKNLRYVEMGIRMSPKALAENTGEYYAEMAAAMSKANTEQEALRLAKQFDIRVRSNRQRTDYTVPPAAQAYQAAKQTAARTFKRSEDTERAAISPSEVMGAVAGLDALDLSPKSDRAKLEATRNPYGGHTLNIGLDIGDKKDALSVAAARAAVKLTGAKILADAVHRSSTENTLVVRTDRALTAAEMKTLAANTRQEAIPQVTGGEGKLHGPLAAKWGPFNPAYFKTIEGKSLSETERPRKAPAAKDKRTGVALTKAMRDASLDEWLYGDRAPFQVTTQAELGELLQEFSNANAEPRVDDTPENREFVAHVVEHEARLALTQDDHAVGWYSHTTDAALRIAALIHPEIGTDPNARFAFTYALAVTSNGATIAENTANAFTVYKSYAKSGRMPDLGFGVRKANMQIAFRTWNEQVYALGLDGFREFMLTKHPVVDLKKINAAIKELTTDSMYGGTIIGPKIGGAFLQNLNGNHDALAMDRWFMRTWGRITGNLVTQSKGLTVTRDQPGSASERHYIRGTMQMALARMQAEHPALTMSDLQAVLWYPEKDLYAMHGVNDESGKPTDYEIEAAKYARAKGIDAAAIEQARGVQPDESAGRGAAGQPEGAGGADREDAGAQSGGPGRAAGDGGQGRGGVELSPKQVTRTPEFKAWFGDSKVVDKNGEPLVVYHGTRSEFDAFDPEQVGSNFGVDSKGFFFTNRALAASRFADPESAFLARGMKPVRELKEGANVMPVYLSIRNPLTLEEYTDMYYTTPAIETDNEGISVTDYFDDNREDVIRKARERGRDGVIFSHDGDALYIVFEPNQIKSVFNDRPTDSPDISMSRKPGSLDLVGVHYSAEAREALDGSYFGTGMKGAEVERVRKATDPRVKTRVYAYVSTGNGVTPEKHVGGQAHVVQLSNVYDADSNPLSLLGADNTAFETAVLDHGFAGYVVRLQNQAVAVMMGDAAKSVAAENRGVGYRGADLPTAPAPVLTEAAKAAQAFMADRSLPSGEMSGENWMRLRPELKLESAKMYYKSDVAKTLHDNKADVSVPAASTRPDNMSGKVSGIDMSPKSAAFKAWFGDSTIVNADGSPKVMYHGTAHDFKVFDPTHPDRRLQAVFLTPDPEFADGFTANKDNSEQYAGGGNIMPVYVRAEKVFDYQNQRDLEAFHQYLIARGFAASAPRLVDDVAGGNWQVIEDDRRVVDYLERNGFDGVYVNELGQKNLAVFDASQIKSAVGNTGEYSRETADITLSPKTPELKAWFGDSKVVDVKGEPLAVYHGSNRKFSEFKTPAYFVDSRREAEDFSGAKRSPVVVEAYLAIKNPVTVDDFYEFSNWNERDVKKYEALGFDGAVLKKARASEPSMFIAFRSDQIKLTSNERPTESANISQSPKIVGASTRAYTPEQLRMFANTGRTVDEKSFADKVKAMRKDLGKKMAQGLVDQFAPLKELSPMAYMLARLSKGAAGAFEAMLHHGKLKITGGAFDADMSGGFIEKVGVPLQGEMEDFLWWVAANRAEGLSAQDRERLFSKSDIAAGKSLANGTLPFDYTLLDGSTTRNRTKAFADSLAKFDGFNKNALDMAEQSGLIDAEARKLWDNEFYVPFFRVSEEDGGFIGAKMKNGLVRQRAFKKLRGGEEKLNADLLANTLANWAHLIDASAKNRAAKAALEAAAQMGVAVEADAATVKSMARSIGKKSSTVWFSDQGVERHFVVDDPFVLTAITSLEFSGLKGPLMDALSTFKHVLTVGVTASPAFKVRNLIRDSLQAIATSDLGYNPVANIKAGIQASDHSTQTYVSALASGGLIRFGTMLEGRASDRVRQLVKQGIKDSTILNSNSKMQAMYDQYLEPAIAAYNEIGNRSEEITRAALYKQLTDKGMDHAQASLMARDLMDFSLQGSWTGIRFLTQVVPFMNARMQGLYKLGRAAGEDPRRFAAVLGATALFSIALMAAYADDDDWKKREDWDRNGFWWFKLGGVAFRIPKPFEVGAIATLAERGLEYFVDPEMTGERLGSNVYQLITNNLSMSIVPQLVKPIVDVYANKDSFSGRPIETMGMEKLQPEYRYTANTSMVARAASTGSLGALSPVQIDHLLRGYFGWLGSFVVGAADAAVRPVTSEPTRPSGDMWKTATQNFVSTLPADQSRYVSHMYEQAQELEQAYGTYRALVKQGRRDEAQEFLADNKDKIAKYRNVEKVKRSTSALNERIRIIERSNLDPGLKQLQISAIRAQQDRVARLVN